MNKVAIVTGSSRGIGKAIALQLAKDGYNIVVNYTNNEEKALKVATLCEAYKVETLCVKADVSNVEEVNAMIEATLQKWGRIDCLVNNSGITKDNILLRLSTQDFNDVINVNLNGTFNCIKAVTKPMMKQKSGVIINMSSVIGIMGNIGQANYAASKAGVIGLTKSVARELVSRNIRCNAVAPGFIETAMTKKLDEKIRNEIVKQVPMQRIGSVSDIANVVSFLASDKANYITGQVINVDGGLVM